MLTTIGRELVRDKLPDAFKHYCDSPLGAKEIGKMCTEMAKADPDRYLDTLQDLNAIGESVVSTYGRNASLSINDIKQSRVVRKLNDTLKSIVKNVLNNDALSSEQKEEKMRELGYKYTQKVMDVVLKDANDRDTALALQIKSKSRGNPVQLMQLQVGNMLMKDALGRDIPYLMIDGYAQGASPTASWMSASSGRRGFYLTQFATGQAGYLGKQVTNVTHDTNISMDDCGTTDTGVPFPANSVKNVGAVLLKPFHNHKAGEIVTDEMVAEAGDDEQMILRSPMTCKAPHGVCAKCNGLTETGKFPMLGEYVSLNAARSFVEKITQGGISCLHPGTLVRMADWSVKRISEIKVGDKVMGCSAQGELAPATVTNVFDNGIQDMWLSTYRQGYKTQRIAALVSTLDHKALQATHKTGCKDAVNNNKPRILPVGYKTHRIGMYASLAPYNGGGEHIKEAFFLGMMTGDGCYTAGVRFEPHYSCADPTLIEDTKEYMASLGLRFAFHKGSQCYWRVSNIENPGDAGFGHTLNRAKVMLDKYGMMGKYAYEKTVPTGFNDWDAQSVSAFISGLWCADGSIFTQRKHGVILAGLASTSLQLVVAVRNALQRHAGVLPVAVHANKSARKRTLYSIVYAKRSDLKKLLEFLKLAGVKEPKRVSALNIINEQMESRRGVLNSTTYVRLGQKHLGPGQAYDIEIDNDSHLFLLANGLVVSNSKHGAARTGKTDMSNQLGDDGAGQPEGFKSVDRMFNAPKDFPGGSVLAPVDGVVSGIQKAAQGGDYVIVGDKACYVPSERKILVKPGDKMVAGDMLTDGVPNPEEVMSLKGIGDGRLYFCNKVTSLLADAGWGVDRRNIESFTRGMLNKVKVTSPDGYGTWLPGDLVNYDDAAAGWEPAEDAVELKANKAINKYLQKPILYYGVGTRVTPRVADTLSKYKMDDVLVSDKKPPFEPVFVKAQSALQHDKHWLPRLAGERLRPALFDAARTGVTDEYDSASYVDKIVNTPYKESL